MSKSPASDRRDADPIVMRLSVGAMANTFFTIGHSTRTIVEFADLLQESGVNLVVDVRSIPRSRANPQFNQQGLPEALAPWQIGYEDIAELGGLAGLSRPNTASMTDMVSAAVFPVSLAASVTRDLRSKMMRSPSQWPMSARSWMEARSLIVWLAASVTPRLQSKKSRKANLNALPSRRFQLAFRAQTPPSKVAPPLDSPGQQRSPRLCIPLRIPLRRPCRHHVGTKADKGRPSLRQG
jgi:hypothetical protein